MDCTGQDSGHDAVRVPHGIRSWTGLNGLSLFKCNSILTWSTTAIGKWMGQMWRRISDNSPLERQVATVVHWKVKQLKLSSPSLPSLCRVPNYPVPSLLPCRIWRFIGRIFVALLSVSSDGRGQADNISHYRQSITPWASIAFMPFQLLRLRRRTSCSLKIHYTTLWPSIQLWTKCRIMSTHQSD